MCLSICCVGFFYFARRLLLFPIREHTIRFKPFFSFSNAMKWYILYSCWYLCKALIFYGNLTRFLNIFGRCISYYKTKNRHTNSHSETTRNWVVTEYNNVVILYYVSVCVFRSSRLFLFFFYSLSKKQKSLHASLFFFTSSELFFFNTLLGCRYYMVLLIFFAIRNKNLLNKNPFCIKNCLSFAT